MMTHRITSLHPATAAMVAALALSTAPAMAQPADEAAQPVAPVAEPAPAPEAAPVEAPALPQLMPAAPQAAVPAPSPATEVVQQTPAAPVAAPAERAPQTAQRNAPAPARPAVAPAASTKQAAVPVAPVAAPAPAPAVAQTGRAPGADLSPATEQPSASADHSSREPLDPSVLWALGGGAFLLVGGVSAFALARRRSPTEEFDKSAEPASVPVPSTPVADRPVAVSFRPAHSGPVPLAAAAPRTAAPADGLHRDLEAMVAAPPSLENPFLTRKKRLRRAKYILAHGLPEPLRGDAEPATARAEEKQFKPQPAYSFSKAQNPPRFSWKPATS